MTWEAKFGSIDDSRISIPLTFELVSSLRQLEVRMASEQWLHEVQLELIAMATRNKWNVRQSPELTVGTRTLEFWITTRFSRVEISSHGFDINGKLLPLDSVGWFDVHVVQQLIAEGLVEPWRDSQRAFFVGLRIESRHFSFANLAA
jgi:hypothetical protein